MVAKRVLLVFETPVLRCPRPRRLLLELSKKHDCQFLCPTYLNEPQDQRRFGYLVKKSRSRFLDCVANGLIKIGCYRLATRIICDKFSIPNIPDGKFDYIFIHDLHFLPHFVHFRKSKIIFDAREYYPLQFADDTKWAKTMGKIAEYLCKKYIPIAYKVLTVSPSIVSLLQKLTGKKVHLFPSYPREELLTLPEIREPGMPFKFIYHGLAHPNRGLERMIEVVSLLGQGYQLDFMLASDSSNSYIQRLKELAKGMANVNFIPPVHPDDIILTCSQYDAGLYLIGESDSQTRYCLPNKFFEFLFAGLPVFTSFSEDMNHYVQEYNLGLAFTLESPEQIANRIKDITADDYLHFRENVVRNTRDWTVAANLRSVIPELA